MNITTFAIFIAILIGLIAFFHYVEGFFSASISAVLAILAAVLAVSYHEPIVEALLKGQMANYAHPMVVLALFAVSYLVPRIIIDQVVPGNVRLPAGLDKIGGAVMGIVAGLAAAGVVTIAAQGMPFTTALWGYARYTFDDKDVSVPIPGKQQKQERKLYQTIEANSFDEAEAGGQAQRLAIPADDLLLGLVRTLSDGGSLAGNQPLVKIHPDWPLELMGQRMGMETTAKRVAPNPHDKPEIIFSGDDADHKDAGIYTHSPVRQRNPEFPTFRTFQGINDLFPPVNPDGNPKNPAKMLVIARVYFTKEARDVKNTFIRTSPGAVRLVTGKPNLENKIVPADYFPIGTLDNAAVLYRQKPDDSLLIDDARQVFTGRPDVDTALVGKDQGIDFVFYVEKNGFVKGGMAAAPDKMTITDGTFVEVKRMARRDLSGVAVRTDLVPNPRIGLLRKAEVLREAAAAATQPGGASPPAAPAPNPTPAVPTVPAPVKPRPTLPGGSPLFPNTPGAPGSPTPAPPTPTPAAGAPTLEVTSIRPYKKFYTGVTAPTPATGQPSPIAGGTVTIRDNKIRAITLDPTDVTSIRGSVIELAAPEDMALLQVEATPAGASAWAWKDQVGEIALKDAAGAAFKAAGVWAEVEDGGTKLLARYSDAVAPLSLASFKPAGKPTTVWFVFLVPKGTAIKQVVSGSTVLKAEDVTAP